MIRKVLLILFIGVTLLLTAEWNNPANRYLNEYKKYEYVIGPIPEDGIKHFVYFARDRESLIDHPLLDHERFSGAQIMYPWELLEPIKDQYDFSIVIEDYLYLKSHGKKLFIQLQDATFYNRNMGIPKYLMTDEYDGGLIKQRDDNGKHQGWVAKRWNPDVQGRFAKLLNALGREFDGKIEGINLQETAIGAANSGDETFTHEGYVEAIKTNMLALKKAFPKSTKLQYANFMPGEWLPWDDKGYLKSIYQYGEAIGVGLGTPDLMVRRKWQLNHALAMMHESSYTVPLGIAVQDGNYIGQTGSDEIKNERENIVPMLHAFAADFLRVDYMFWVNQEPYFENDVLTSF